MRIIENPNLCSWMWMEGCGPTITIPCMRITADVTRAFHVWVPIRILVAPPCNRDRTMDELEVG